jgi:CheY-like chemotaxis protein
MSPMRLLPATQFLRKELDEMRTSIHDLSDLQSERPRTRAENAGGVQEHFRQGWMDKLITRRYGSTGLGLEISRRLVEYMGGALTVSSREGEGTTFRFNVRFEQGIQSEKKAPLKVTGFQGRRILVIDDNATNRFILGETLNAWGIESAEFGAPTEALTNLTAANAAKRPYSLVLVDSDMPGMDGFETTVRIKELAPELPVIMFTSDVRPGDIRAAPGSGALRVCRQAGEAYRVVALALCSHAVEGRRGNATTGKRE